MNSKNIKIMVSLLIVIFFITFLKNLSLNEEDERILNFRIKVAHNALLNKDITIEFNNIFFSNFVNYYHLIEVNSIFLKDFNKLKKKSSNFKEIQNIQNIFNKKEESIDLIKRANSIIHNSFSYIKTIQMKFSLISSNKELESISRKIVDLTYDIKFADNSILEKYENLIKELKQTKTQNKNNSIFKNSMVIHSKKILTYAKNMQKNINNFRQIDKELNHNYLELKKHIDITHSKIKNKLLYTQIVLVVLFITFLIFIIRLLSIEKENKREQKRLQKLIDKNIIISKTDLSGKIISVSDALCKISGYEKEELIGESHNILRHSDMPKELFKEMWETITAGKRWQGFIKNRKKDGGFYWVDAITEPIFNKKGEITSYISMRVDISDKKRLEELTKNQRILIDAQVSIANEQRDKALIANRAKSQFLANMSHEIRTPLNGILGFVDILKDSIKDDESKKHLQIINNSSNHLLGIINDILDFSKIESGKLEIEYIDFDPVKELTGTIDLFKAKSSEKNIYLDVNFSNLPTILNGDPLRIKQVISNLLSNAIKFTDSGKEIKVSIYYTNSSLLVCVKDSGIGIKKENLPNIFEPFSQEDSTTTRKFGGTGLGLTICSQLVKLMNGSISVSSELGFGSEFCFSIPLEKGKLSKLDVSNKKCNTDLTGHILLVEDNLTNQQFMKIILKKMNLTFDIANDGIEAVEAFKKNSYDIILMDENMPNMNGIEATKEILDFEKSNNLKHTPIIALTANALKGDREKFINAGMDEYLSKPVKKETLKEMLTKFLC